MEVWKDVVGFEGIYQVSSDGRMRSLERKIIDKNGRIKSLKEKVLKTRLDSHGNYCIIDLRNYKNKKTYLVHRLIGFAFLELTDDLEINHKNGIKNDNRIENLEVVTHSENGLHSFRELGRKHACLGKCGCLNARSKPVIKYDIDTEEIIEKFESTCLASKSGYDPSAIVKCCKGKEKHHRGFGWRYA